MSKPTMNQRNAADYVHRVGLKEARQSVHYATAKICKCGTCFCCEVFNATYQPKTGVPCHCRRGQQRDNCPDCEGTGQRIDFAAIRNR